MDAMEVAASRTDENRMFCEAFMKMADAVSSHPAVDLNNVHERFWRTVLAYGSRTEGNVGSVESTKIRDVRDRIQPKFVKRGLCTEPSGALFSELACSLEDAEMPASIRTAHPALSQVEWEAFRRLNVLLWLSLESVAARR